MVFVDVCLKRFNLTYRTIFLKLQIQFNLLTNLYFYSLIDYIYLESYSSVCEGLSYALKHYLLGSS